MTLSLQGKGPKHRNFIAHFVLYFQSIVVTLGFFARHETTSNTHKAPVLTSLKKDLTFQGGPPRIAIPIGQYFLNLP